MSGPAALLGGSPERPRLNGSRCRQCGEPYFPAASACTRCCAEDQEPLDLGDTGTLWSWTVQGFLPKRPYAGDETPETFRPFGVGYVEMPCGLKVEARLTRAEELAIGMPMRLVREPLGAAEVFAFAPAGETP